MYVFLPDTGFNPATWIGALSDPNWQPLQIAQFRMETGTLVLPKFRLEDSVPLKQPLQALGMKTAFDREGADFSGIGPGLYISTVLQKTFVEVKEEGTEAAAVTTVTMVNSAAFMPPPHPFNMVVDRPFLFVIRDDRTGIILFIGLIYDPPSN
jgi:serine protease inhibitor